MLISTKIKSRKLYTCRICKSLNQMSLFCVFNSQHRVRKSLISEKIIVAHMTKTIMIFDNKHKKLIFATKQNMKKKVKLSCRLEVVKVKIKIKYIKKRNLFSYSSFLTASLFNL